MITRCLSSFIQRRTFFPILPRKTKFLSVWKGMRYVLKSWFFEIWTAEMLINVVWAMWWLASCYQLSKQDQLQSWSFFMIKLLRMTTSQVLSIWNDNSTVSLGHPFQHINKPPMETISRCTSCTSYPPSLHLYPLILSLCTSGKRLTSHSL